MNTGQEWMQQNSPTREDVFRRDLAALINRYSLEGLSNTPDFLLADYMIACLKVYSESVNKRENWYGRERKFLATGDARYAADSEERGKDG